MVFLGFDVSTQQLKIVVTNRQLHIVNTYYVEFDEISKYNTKNGVITNDDGSVLSCVLLWLDAIDYIFNKMKSVNFPFDQVVGISGSCQQHGCVFWNQSGEELLNNLDTSKSLLDNLVSGLYPYAPNWQDHSTSKELTDFENLWGKEKLAEITGSTAHHRFTGLQIRKFATHSDLNNIYQNSARISLVSSFIASILLSKITQIEESDACGMNLYDIQKQEFNEELLALAAGVENADEKTKHEAIEELKSKLGPIFPINYESLGNISNYFTKKYNFNPDCKIYSFTGDNLATIISLTLKPNDYLISLGTSTTVLLVTKNYKPSPFYHLFKHPTLPDHYMGMICYCNGALAREKIKVELNNRFNLPSESWDKFNEVLDSRSSFNNKLGIYFPLGEIVPNAKAQTKRSILINDSLKDVELDDKNWLIEDDVNAIIDSQTLSCRLRASPMLSDETIQSNNELKSIYSNLISKFGTLSTDGQDQTYESLVKRPNKCFYVGGGSNNKSIIKKMGSILSPTEGNYKVEMPNACGLGGAFKASWSYTCETEGYVRYDTYIQEKLDKHEELKKFDAEDKWLDYFTGCGMLSKMESQLIHK